MPARHSRAKRQRALQRVPGCKTACAEAAAAGKPPPQTTCSVPGGASVTGSELTLKLSQVHYTPPTKFSFVLGFMMFTPGLLQRSGSVWQC